MLKEATAIVTTCASSLVIAVVMFLQHFSAILVRIYNALIINGYLRFCRERVAYENSYSYNI